MNGASASTVSPDVPVLSAPSMSAATRRRMVSPDRLAAILVMAVSILLWIPRHAGPLDLRFDGSVYYIL